MLLTKVLVIIILVIIIYVIYSLISFKEDLPEHDYKAIRSTLQTGDIILFSCNEHDSALDKLMYGLRTKLLGSEYGHVGLIFKSSSGEIYLVECTDKSHIGHWFEVPFNNKNKGGVRIINFDKLIEEYYEKTKAYFAVMSTYYPIPNKLFTSKLSKYTDIIFENKNILICLVAIDTYMSHDLAVKAIQKLNTNNDRTNRMMCSEFVYDFLYECGVVDNYCSKLFWPHLFPSVYFNMLSKVKYSKPIKFCYLT